MNLPKSSIWQEFRQECLEAIPQGSRFPYTSPVPLRDWRSKGYYTVAKATPKAFTLISANTEIGSALLSDSEYLLDHAAEHQVSVWNIVNKPDWSSSAWLVVTFYYWAFFLAMCFTRLLGRTVWYLDGNAIKGLNLLAPSVSPPVKSAGAGSYTLKCGAAINGTERTVELAKSKDSRVHEHLWKHLFAIFTEKANNHSAGSASNLEARLFTCICRSSSHLGPEWPSELRNAVNYRPGFAYDTIRRSRVLESFTYLSTQPKQPIEQIIDRLENHIASVSSPTAIVHNPKVVSRILVDFTFALHAMANELHLELIERNGLDPRWRNNRGKFIKSHGLNSQNVNWPCV